MVIIIILDTVPVASFSTQCQDYKVIAKGMSIYNSFFQCSTSVSHYNPCYLLPDIQPRISQYGSFGFLRSIVTLTKAAQ